MLRASKECQVVLRALFEISEFFDFFEILGMLKNTKEWYGTLTNTTGKCTSSASTARLSTKNALGKLVVLKKFHLTKLHVGNCHIFF